MKKTAKLCVLEIKKYNRINLHDIIFINKNYKIERIKMPIDRSKKYYICLGILNRFKKRFAAFIK